MRDRPLLLALQRFGLARILSSLCRMLIFMEVSYVEGERREGEREEWREGERKGR